MVSVRPTPPTPLGTEDTMTTPTLPARNPVLREHLFAAGFTDAGPQRVAAPEGMNRRQAKSAFSKVFLSTAIVEHDVVYGDTVVVGFAPVPA
jgi:hypothetical protein